MTLNLPVIRDLMRSTLTSFKQLTQYKAALFYRPDAVVLLLPLTVTPFKKTLFITE